MLLLPLVNKNNLMKIINKDILYLYCIVCCDTTNTEILAARWRCRSDTRSPIMKTWCAWTQRDLPKGPRVWRLRCPRTRSRPKGARCLHEPRRDVSPRQGDVQPGHALWRMNAGLAYSHQRSKDRQKKKRTNRWTDYWLHCCFLLGACWRVRLARAVRYLCLWRACPSQPQTATVETVIELSHQIKTADAMQPWWREWWNVTLTDVVTCLMAISCWRAAGIGHATGHTTGACRHGFIQTGCHYAASVSRRSTSLVWTILSHTFTYTHAHTFCSICCVYL